MKYVKNSPTISKNKLIVLTFISYIAFQIKPEIVEGSSNLYQNTVSNLLGSINGLGLNNILIFPLLYFFYKYTEQFLCHIDKKWTIVLPSLFFSFFMILGYSFEQTDSLYFLKNFRNGQLIKNIVILTGYFIFFYFSINYFYYFFDHITFSSNRHPTSSSNKYSIKNLINLYLHLLTTFPFRTTFLTLFIAYIPYVIISYPAIFQGDTYSQIVQAYKQLGTSGIYYMTNDQLLSSNIFINQHHPVVHTLLIHIFLLIGSTLFHSLNVGIFFYALFQWAACILTISYGIKVLIKDAKISEKYAILCVIYFIISPRIQNYMFLVTKDVLYSVFFLLEIIFIFQIFIFKDNDAKKQKYKFFALLLTSSIGMILFRNEAVYILIVSFLFIACEYKKSRKIMLNYTCLIALFSLLFFKLLLPIFSITPGSIREMLAVPFQQTARYVRDCESEITLEEKNAISAILNYSKLAEKYDPNNVDNVKATYNEYASAKDLINYFEAWFQMGLKHPGVYIQATMNNYYRYFYPGTVALSSNSYGWSEECMNLTNETLKPLGMQFSYPARLNNFREKYDFLFHREFIDNIPFLNILAIPAIYVWIIILLLFYSIKNKNPQMKALLMIPCFTILMRLLGPCNGQYCRYIYPIILTLPFIIPLLLYFRKKE